MRHYHRFLFIAVSFVIILFGCESSNNQNQVSKETVSAFVRSLSDPSPEKRKNAAIALGDILPQTLPKSLKQQLKADDFDVVVKARGKMNKILPGVGQALHEAMKDKDPEVRRAAALALGRICPSHLVMTTLKDIDVEVRASIFAVLVEMGPESVPSLVQMLKWLCEQILGDYQDLRSVQRAIKSSQLNYIAQMLARIGPYATSALREILLSEQKRACANLVSTWILFKIDQNARDSTDNMTAILVDTENLYDVPANVLMSAAQDLKEWYMLH